MDKPNCYECKHRGEVVGSAHSCCNHPKCDQSKGEIMGLLSALGKGFMPEIKTELNIKGNPQGIKNGWFFWPFNFDPTWLEECDGFESKEAVEN